MVAMLQDLYILHFCIYKMRILQEKKRSEFCTRIVAENDTRNVSSGTNNYRTRDQNNTKEGDKMSNIYSNHLIVRMTDKEKSMLQEAANRKGVTMSKYVRDACINPPNVTRAEYNEIRSMIHYEIRKLGVNINQIAKKYNEYAYVEPSLDLLDKLNKIIDLMYKITDRIES